MVCQRHIFHIYIELTVIKKETVCFHVRKLHIQSTGSCLNYKVRNIQTSLQPTDMCNTAVQSSPEGNHLIYVPVSTRIKQITAEKGDVSLPQHNAHCV